MLYARSIHGDVLHDTAPLFALPLQQDSLKAEFLPLAYSDICAADKIRTEALGNLNIPFRSHLRRKGGASDLFDAGVPIKDIKVVGHWSMGVLKPYLSWTSEQIAALQLQGIIRAEKRRKYSWWSKIMVNT